MQFRSLAEQHEEQEQQNGECGVDIKGSSNGTHHPALTQTPSRIKYLEISPRKLW